MKIGLVFPGKFPALCIGAAFLLVLATPGCTTGSPAAAADDSPLPSVALSYPAVDTGQAKCYDAIAEIAAPAFGQPFYGQDAQSAGRQPSYALGGDGKTVRDNVTGLTWQRSADTDGDGAVHSNDKLTWSEAQARPAALNADGFGGFSDWRLPTIKELYSLIDFRGTDPRALGIDTSGLTPFIDTAFFLFSWGDTSADERIIDAQYWSKTAYASTTMNGNATLFGVNFADGRIKGYPRDVGPRGPASEYLLCVRGNPDYGANDLADNGDGAIRDRATGLMWSKADSGRGMNWQEALAWVQEQNKANYLGHGDWRLPNAKELQSIVDYSRCPDSTASAASDPLFSCSGITNEAGEADYPCYWTGTTHASSDGSGAAAVYIAFGRAMGFMNGKWQDVHGAGAQRSDPKAGNPADYPYGRGPQGDAVRIQNHVRLVRDDA